MNNQADANFRTKTYQRKIFKNRIKAYTAYINISKTIFVTIYLQFPLGLVIPR